MAYKVNHTDVARYGSLVVEDKTVNSQTSIKLLGKKYAGYSKIMAENLLQMMENFANINPPDTPVVGQLWYNSDAKSISPNPTLMMWDGTNWVPSAHVSKSLVEPPAPSVGDLWVDLSTTQLKLRTGNTSTPWLSLGSMVEVDAYDQRTGLVYDKIFDEAGVLQPVIRIFNSGALLGIWANSSFRPQSSDDVPGFVDPDTLHPVLLYSGLNVNPLYKIYGTSTAAESLMVNGNKYDTSLFLRTNDNNPTITNGLKISHNNGLTFGSNIVPASLKVDGSFNVVLSSDNRDIILQTTGSNLTISPSGITTGTTFTINNTLIVDDCAIENGITAHTAAFHTISVLANSPAMPGKLIVDGTVEPSANGSGSIGTTATKWGSVNSEIINCTELICATPITGELSPDVTISNRKIVTTATKFSMDGEMTAGETFVDEVTNSVKLTSALKYNVINGKNTLTTFNSTDLQIAENAKTLVFYNNGIYLMSVKQLSAPIGSIILHAGSTVPAGYLKCDGSEYNIIAYQVLYSVISTRYGGGSGKFNVPSIPDIMTGVSYYIFTGAQ